MLFEVQELELCAFASMIATERHSLECFISNPLLSSVLHDIFMNYECCMR